MKLSSCISRAAVRRSWSAFTLPEIMVVMVIFLLLVAALISGHIFGLRMSRITETRLSSTDNSRKVLSRVRDDVLSSKSLVVGNISGASFTPIPNNSLQIGNALEIHATTDLTKFTRYYLNTNDHTFYRVPSGGGSPETLANSITNLLAFQAEDFKGNVSTNNQNCRTIRMELEFYRGEYPPPAGGSTGLFDYYHLQTRITRRLIE